MASQTVSLTSCTMCSSSISVRQCTCGLAAYCGKTCQKQDWRRHKQDCSLVVVKELEGKGKGLVATRRIPAGTVIFTEDPLVVVKSSRVKATLVIQEKFNKFQKLDKKLKEDFLALYDPVGLESDQEWRSLWYMNGREDPELIKFWRIFCTNRVGVGLAVLGSDDFKQGDLIIGVYKQFSRINHSCSSNVVQDWKSETSLKIDVISSTPIKKGEELTLDYLALGKLCTWDLRKQKLVDRKWSIQCRCEVCSLDMEERDKNDMIRRFINFHMEKVNSEHGMASMSPIMFLNTYLQVLLACYSIENQAKDILPIVLGICHRAYQTVKLLSLSWECPTEVKKKMVLRLGPNFLECLNKEAVTKAGVLGSGMVKLVRSEECIVK